MTATPPASRRRIPWRPVGLLGVIAALVVAYFLHSPRETQQPPADSGTPLPSLSTSPFLNTRPDVAYVGDAVCADCHQQQFDDYRLHPMGRSLFAVSDFPAVEQYEHTSNPFAVGPLRFQVIRRGKELIHKEWCADARGNVVAEKETAIAYVVGSGTQARSYLSHSDGFMFQSPITWYASPPHWGLSPSFEHTQFHFSRRIDSRCLYCHSDQPRPNEQSIGQYRQPPFAQMAIGCERCHGPGALHASNPPKALTPGQPDINIVNPKYLQPALRDNICEQCHLQGETIVVRRGRSQLDYRPGLPLHEFMSVFVRAPDITDESKIVSHFEQMYLSACQQKSGGHFSCTSCHDPHRMPPKAEMAVFYRQRCLNCHDAAARKSPVTAPACSLPLAQRTANNINDNCITCHMPRNNSSNANHLAVTDHRVLRKPDQKPRPIAERNSTDLPLVNYHRQLLKPDDEAHSRDFGIAIAELATLADDKVRDVLCKRALAPLEQATTHAPDDVPALEARGYALFITGKPVDGLQVLQSALAKAPDREETLDRAMHIANLTGRLDLAEEYGRRLTEKYPKYYHHHERLAVVYVQKQNWPLALSEAQTAVRLEPFDAQSRAVLISVLLATGDHAQAQREFDALGVINANHQERIRSWFEERMRGRK